MNNKFSKIINRKLTILAYYEIAGGVAGLVVMLYLLSQLGARTGMLLLLLLFVASIYPFSIYCDKKILKGDIKLALSLSIIVQGLQIVSFSLLGYAYRFVSGIGFLIGFEFFDGFNFRFNFQISNFKINYASDDNIVSLMVNVVAVYLIQYIIEIQEDIKEHELILSLDNSNIDTV